ncbi:MAG: trypsin-like peptidase domain-containing protein [Solirubrobacteraceae bacterium]|nr:trypsin-like peptidase domain-containing protein [Solirubrobacteraceae bacterium]
MPKQPPRSLWTDREDDAHERWLTPDPEAPTTAYQRDPRPMRPAKKKRVWRRRVLAVLGVAALAGGGVLVGQQLGDKTDVAGNPQITIPVVKGKTEETRANEIYSQVKNGVVQIKTSDGSGTGFVIDKNGTIVTNAHVVSGSTNVKVYFDDSNDGVDGTVTGTDVSSDLASVKVDPKDAKLVPLALADSDDVNPGDEVLAIGYPLGLDRTLTEGIVSGLGRQIQAQNGFSIDKVIQTDASINPGNSGGPLIDSRGRVIGVNSQIATSSAAGGNTGIGFAIPSNTVRAVIPKLAAGQTVKHAYLGVSLTNGNNPGAEVADVTAGGPSDKGGLRSGDVVKAIDGTKVETSDELISTIAQMAPGQTVELSVERGGSDEKVKVTLGERPNNVASAQQSSGGSGGSGGGSGTNPFQIP